MSASDPELASMEDSHVVEDEDNSLIVVSPPSTIIHPLSPLFKTTVSPDFTGESILESKAISMASNDCSSDASSPAEASPTKPAETSTSIFEKTLDKSPTTSHTAAASDSIKCTVMSIVNISDVPFWSPEVPSLTFGSPELKDDFPATLTFKGVSVTLENNSIWKQFHQCGTEMILTKQGRRMFPYCRYRLSGLDPERLYSLVLSIVPSDQFKYRWNTSKWGVNGPTEHQTQGLIRAFSHHYSPCRGSEWMSCLVSFYKLKLTNNFQDQDGHIVLHSMHRYIPRLHVIPLPDGNAPTADQPVVVGPESVTFTFPQTEFMAVTTYQNFRITQLKINHNPFAKSFREHGSNPFLHKVLTPAVNTDTEPGVFKPEELSEHKEETVDLSTTNQNSAAAASSSVQETRLVLKPIMSNPSGTGDSYVPCIRGKHALGELVLVDKHPDNKPEEENGGTPDVQQGLKMSKASITPSSSTSTPRTTRRYRRRRKKNGNRRWITYRPRAWKAASAAASSPKVSPSPSLTVAMQPELDDIEGLLFVSFTTKEALDVHVRDMPASISSLQSPVPSTRPTESKEIMEANPQTVEEKTAGLEQVLLNDLKALRHRQVIHPVLQEVGLKLSALDPSTPIDLNYLGVCLPLPLPSLPEQSDSPAVPPADKGLPFISRTGKTSDMTKIKGWKNKFIKSQETSASNSEETQKKLSAFWSIMLDEYLESEAQQISERADAFSTNPEGSVAYQLPAKGSSYVKTLDSVLKNRNAAPSSRAPANRPCPLSRKPLLRSFLRTPTSPLASPETPGPSSDQSTSMLTRLGAAAASGSSYNADVSQRLSDSQTEASKKPEVSFSHKQLMAYKSLGLNKVQLKLLWMEIRALNQGLSRTQLTPERLKMALTVLLTKQTLVGQMLKVPPLSITEAGPECGQEFCRLGCVCSSLQLLDRGPVHCRQPECMFGCSCSNTLTTTEHKVQPQQDFSSKKLWNCNTYDNDSDQLYAPASAPPLPPPKIVKSSIPYSAPLVREEDKDPVYKYLESLMTCARVRDFNSQPPPEVSLDTDIAAAISKMNNTPKPQHLTEKEDSAVLTYQKAEEKPPQENTFNEKEARKQIEVQLLCQWKKDREKILEGLNKRLNMDRLHRRFYVGPYCINPVSKVILQKPSGNLVSYRVQISKPSKVSDCEEEESDEHDDYNYDENTDAVEDEPVEEPWSWYGVTPFLSGVTPAGRLRAKKKPAFVKASGLIQVNGKYYNHARLLLGNVGSLHPANRLAAHVTGRLRLPSSTPQTESQNQGPPQKTDSAGSPCVNILVRSIQKTISQPSNSVNKGFISLQQLPQNSLTINPVQLLVPVQKSSSSSPVCLTVSPSLKNPSFLGQSGTYSFRIFPPSNQAGGGQNPPGIVLPGGFTLIELPKPGAAGASQPAKPPNTVGTESAGDTPPQKEETASNLSHLAREWVGFDTLGKVKDMLISKHGESSSSGLTSDDKVPSGENNEEDNNQTQEESNFDFLSDELSSDFSDDDELEDYDETVDIETVEEGKQGEAIAKMREAALTDLQETRDFLDDFGPPKEPRKNEGRTNKKKAMRRNHRALEKLRRCEQKVLFSKLQGVLRSNPKTPRLHVLSLAVKEILSLKTTSKHLEQQKTQLLQQQSVFVKKLSQLSGKSESLIQNKLHEIFDRMKQREKNMKWRPFFSQLLETKAALLQATAPKSHVQSSLLPQHNANHPPPQFELSKTSPDNLQMMLSLLHPTKNLQKSSDQHSENTSTTQAESPLRQKITTTSSQMENQQTEPGASGDPEQANTSNPQTEDQPSSDKTPPQVIAPPNGPTSGSSVPQKTNVAVPLAALPLIRSKTGRIILPSSLKPLGHGFYTLMVMEPKQKEAEEEVSSSANVQPSDGDSSKNLEGTISSTDQPPNLEGKHVAEDKASPSESDPRSSAGAGVTPLAELAFTNQSIVGPSLDLTATEKNQETGSDVSLTKAPGSARLCFNPVSPPPPPVNSEPDPSPPIGGRRRGRPLKNQGSPVGAVTKEAVVEEPKISVTDIKILRLMPQTQSDTELSSVQAKGASREAADEQAPARRGRGRPRKKTLGSMHGPSVKRAARSPSMSKDDSPVRFSIGSFKSPNSANSQKDVYVSRPLTRASLGKDFPSAKKRSWIDVEKELDPDLEYT